MTKKCTHSLSQLMNDSQQYNTTLPPHSTHAEMIRDFNPSGFLIKVTLHASGASISAVAATTERVFAVVHIYP